MDHTFVKLLSKFSNSEPWHAGLAWRSKNLHWLPSDTEENFNRMMQDPQHRAYFAEQGWLEPNAITYRINSHGFRGDEFDGGPYLLTLGCSFTLGIGLPEQSVWPYRVGAALGLKVANIAWGGSAADSCARLALHWIPRLKPVLVIMLSPPPDRIEIGVSNNEFEVYMPQCSDIKFGNDVWLKHWHVNDVNSELNTLKNQLSVKQICSEIGVPCGIYSSFEAFGRSREEAGYARDYMHAGPKGHEMLASKMINDWYENTHT